jgi:kynurenine formamidase
MGWVMNFPVGNQGCSWGHERDREIHGRKGKDGIENWGTHRQLQMIDTIRRFQSMTLIKKKGEKKMRLIDLSLPLQDSSPSEPTTFGEKFGSPARITYFPHSVGAELYLSTFNCTYDDLPDGLGNGVEVVHGLTHNSTHLDAPWHFAPTSEGKKAKTIDEIPLEWCYGDCVVLDMRHKKTDEEIFAKDAQAVLKKIGYKVKPMDIVFFQTGADKLWGKPEYQTHYPGVTRDVAEYFIDQGVKIMGVDAYNFDLPFPTQKRLFHQTGDKKVIEPCHYLGRDREYLHIEKLANLDKLPRPFGFKVACFPIKIKNGSAGWVRVVAFVED